MMIQTGLSGWRLVAPLMASGALAGAVCTVAVNPVVSAAHLAAQGRTVSSPAASRIVTTAANGTTILLADPVLPDGSEREGLSVIRRDAVHRLHARFTAKKARWTGNEWRLTGLQVLVAAPDGTSPVLELAPDLLTGRFGNQLTTPTLALPSAIACANAIGAPSQGYRLQLQGLIALPPFRSRLACPRRWPRPWCFSRCPGGGKAVQH